MKTGKTKNQNQRRKSGGNGTSVCASAPDLHRDRLSDVLCIDSFHQRAGICGKN